MALNEEKIKNSFKNIKKDMDLILNELNSFKDLLKGQNEKILSLNKELRSQISLNNQNKSDFKAINESSTGNKGVNQSINQSFNQSNPNQSFNHEIANFKRDFDEIFINLSKQPFLVFLTIYQLEEDFNRPINYDELAQRMNLTKECLRAYISHLLKKRVPILKTRKNNRVVYLSVHEKFKDLNLKSHLFGLYMQNNPEQTTFSDY
jgi:hypothetical protein